MYYNCVACLLNKKLHAKFCDRCKKHKFHLMELKNSKAVGEKIGNSKGEGRVNNNRILRALGGGGGGRESFGISKGKGG